MTKIDSIKLPDDKINRKMTAIERFLWWKKTFYLTFGILITILIIPLFLFYRGNVNLGIRISILFYLALILIRFMAFRVTEKKDKEFLVESGYDVTKKKRWWRLPLRFLFIGLQIWVLYIMYRVWGMTN